MPQRRVLHFDGIDLRALLWHAGHLREEGVFAADEAGVQAFRGYVRTHRRSNFRLLVDGADEGFHMESVPYAQGADRKALLSRKLSQFFYGTPYAVAVSLGREKSGRRDERMLFSALTRPQVLEPWVNCLIAEEARLAGIYTVAQLAQQLLKKLDLRLDRCVLVSIGRNAVRQTFLEQGALRFSRLSLVPEMAQAELARTCAAESEKIYQYLAAQRMIPRDAPLTTLLLVHPSRAAAFTEACRSTEELRYRILDLHAAARRTGLKTSPADSRCEPVFAHLLCQFPPAHQYAPPPAQRYYRLWQMRTGMIGAGAAALISCLLWAGGQVFEAMSLAAERNRLRAQAELDGQRYAQLMQGLPPVPVGTDDLRALIERYQQLEKRSPDPFDLFVAVSRALDVFPEIEVERIEWSAGEQTDGTAKEAARPGAAPESADAQAKGGTAVIHAMLPAAMQADHRAMLGKINGFAAALRQVKLDVTGQRMPSDLESGKSLKGGGEEQGRTEPPRFVLHVARGARP
ncbi:MAG: hypothetical protein AB1768_00815 [Pseudomonadota bacterium]|jgi:hypothetical protein